MFARNNKYEITSSQNISFLIIYFKKDILNDVRECSKTPLGRGRVFVRVALNEGAVVDYLKALVWNRELARYAKRGGGRKG